MLSDSEKHKITLSILKGAEKMRSFVIEETALADLLTRAWKPIGAAIKKQLSVSIDFKKAKFSQEAAFEIELWMTPEMYNAQLEKQWQEIAPVVENYLAASYKRAWKEKGMDPFAVYKVDDSEDEWDEYWEDLEREGSSLEREADPRTAKAVAVISALLALARSEFTVYAEETAVPTALTAISALRKLSSLEKDIGTVEDKNAKRQLAAIQVQRQQMIDKLQEVLDGATHAAGTSNITVARAHHFGFLDWAESNQVTYYQVVALLEDQKTCDACIEMHGKIFAVSDAVRFKNKFLSILGDKDALKKEAPFLTKQAAESVRGFVIKKSGDVFYFPQFHPRCRCTVVAVYSEVVSE